MTGHLSRLANFVWAYKTGRTKLPYGPIFVWLEPTNRCNLKCPLCPTGVGLKRRRGDMSLELFETILAKLKKAKPLLLTLHLAGEPLLAPNLTRMVELAREAGMQTTLSSNGTLLTEEMSQKLIDSGLQSLRLDFCAEKDHFEKVRFGSSWEKVYANIIGLLSLKLKTEAQLPMVRIKDVSTWGLSKQEQKMRMDKLQALFEEFPIDGYDGLGPLQVHNWAGTFASEHEDPEHHAEDDCRIHPCTHLWTSMAVTYDGLVVPCCRDLEAECVLGDLKTQELDDIWNGEEILKLRKAMTDGDVSGVPLCRSCSKVHDKTRFLFYACGYLYMRLHKVIQDARGRSRRSK